MPARSWSKGTDHAAQYPRRPYDNQYHHYCWKCHAWKLHAKGRKYYTCLTCSTRTEKGILTQREADVCQECGKIETIDPNNDGVVVCVECGTRR